MGLFFKDLKDDLSESVNNLPDDTNNASDDSDDVMVNTLDDPELAKMAEAFKMEAQEYDMSEDTSSPETDMGNVSDKDETKEDIKNAAENPEYIADETAVITEGLSIKGDLDSLGSIDLFGTVEGNVTCRGKLTVSGSITGSSKANEFFANDAQVDGDIEAKGAVKIGQGTVVVGNITATSAVIGGGNYWRGRSNDNIDRTKADQIGMLATIMNCIYVSEIFRSQGLKTNILTPFECGSMTKLFSKDRANKYFEKGMVVFFAGGTGHPYFSTDTGIVLRAIELDADAILLAKAIDGIYDSDPKLNPEAKKYDTISINEVVEKKLGVIDMTASVMCMENKMPLMVFGLEEENSIVNALSGKFNGTVVTVD